MASPEDIILNEIDKQMDVVVDRIFSRSQENLLRPHVKVFKDGTSKDVITTDTSNLLKTANVNRKFLEKTITYPAPYASDVEKGNAGKVVTERELESWVRRKVLKNQGTKAQIRRTTRNIAKSLRERGQAADPYLQPAIDFIEGDFNRTRGEFK